MESADTEKRPHVGTGSLASAITSHSCAIATEARHPTCGRLATALASVARPRLFPNNPVPLNPDDRVRGFSEMATHACLFKVGAEPSHGGTHGRAWHTQIAGDLRD